MSKDMCGCLVVFLRGRYLVLDQYPLFQRWEFSSVFKNSTSEVSTEIPLLMCGEKGCDSFQCKMDVEKWVRGISF